MRSHADNAFIELVPVIASSSRTRRSFEDTAPTGPQDHEPLLSAAFGLSRNPDDDRSPDTSTPTSPDRPTYFADSLPSSALRRRFHYYKATMEKTHESKFRYYARKLAVESEPGLTNAQLMLTNHDLKPGTTHYLCTFIYGDATDHSPSRT
jgi:hypothetical protein